MIWTALPKSELSAIINQFGPGLINRLVELLPLLHTGKAHTDIGQTSTLARIAESFLPSDIFADRKFRRALLYRLEPMRLKKVCDVMPGCAGAARFGEMVDALVACPYAQLVRALVSLGELSERFLPIEVQPLPGVTEILPPSSDHPVLISSPFRQLLDYQHFIYSECAKLLEAPRSRAILQMPTGSGKTRTAMELIASHLNAGSTAVVVWLAHSEELCDQAADSFAGVFSHLARSPATVVRNWGGLYRGDLPKGNALVVTTYQTLCRGGGVLKGVKRNRIALVVSDEAHMAVAPKYNQAIKNHLGASTCVLGLTATPVRADDEQTLKLRRFFFDTIISSSDHPDFETARLQERGILARPIFTVANTDIWIDVTAKESNDFADQRDVSGTVLKKLSQESTRNALILNNCLALAKTNKATLLFGCSVEHSRFLSSMLICCGVKAAHVDGTCDRDYRRTVIEAFRHGALSVLCNFGVLTTGFDAPNTDAVVLARPTLSPVLYSQMVGRAMRGPKMGGKASTQVIDIRDNFRLHGKPLDLFERFRAMWGHG